MRTRHFTLAALAMFWSVAAAADIIGPLPFTLSNNTLADATQVQANFNQIVNQTNTNAATAGLNSNITAITGLTTPLNYTLGGSSAYIGGTSTGSANAQVVATPVPSGFSLVAGKRITFTAGFTNTATLQINIAGTGLRDVYRTTSTGPTATTGGEVGIGNLVELFYDGTRFQLLNSAAPAVPTGTVAPYTGFTPPSGWIFANGQALSRTTYNVLFATVSFSTSAVTTLGSKIVTGISSTTNLAPGMPVGGNNVTCGDTIATVDSATQVTLTTNNASASGSTTLVFAPYGVGNCTTTFNAPDLRGRSPFGSDTMAASAASRLTLAGSSVNGATIGATGGLQNTTLLQANLPNVTLTTTIAAGQGSHTHALANAGVIISATVTAGQAAPGANYGATSIAAATLPAMTGTTPTGGSGTAAVTIPPLQIFNYIVKT